jgi:hypothetical protein
MDRKSHRGPNTREKQARSPSPFWPKKRERERADNEENHHRGLKINREMSSEGESDEGIEEGINNLVRQGDEVFAFFKRGVADSRDVFEIFEALEIALIFPITHDVLPRRYSKSALTLIKAVLSALLMQTLLIGVTAQVFPLS